MGGISFVTLIESTALSRVFADQGVKIRIRKEVRNKKTKRNPDDPDSGDEDSPIDNSGEHYDQSSDFLREPSDRDSKRMRVTIVFLMLA